MVQSDIAAVPANGAYSIKGALGEGVVRHKLWRGEPVWAHKAQVYVENDAEESWYLVEYLAVLGGDAGT